MNNTTEKGRGRQAVDHTGARFGRLTVIERAPVPEGAKTKGAFWLVRCDCGTEYVTPAKNFVSGASTQCKRCGWDSLKNPVCSCCGQAIRHHTEGEPS